MENSLNKRRWRYDEDGTLENGKVNATAKGVERYSQS